MDKFFDKVVIGAWPFWMFVVGFALGYWMAPDDNFRDDVNTCVEFGVHDTESCIRLVAEHHIEGMYYHSTK